MNNYAKFLEECYFTTECKPYYLKGKESLNGMKKYYATDVGLRSNLSEVIEYDDSFALENVIYNELIYRGYTVKYGKFPEGEIDFVVQKGNKKCLIQVAYQRRDLPSGSLSPPSGRLCFGQHSVVLLPQSFKSNV